jgi:hypothetical protein
MRWRRVRGWEEGGVDHGGIDEMGGEGMLGVQDVIFALRVVGIGVALMVLVAIVLVDLPATSGAVSVLSCGDGLREAGRRNDEVHARRGLN